MTSPALKTEGYLINTLHLDRCDTAFVCEFFNQCQGNEALKSTPIVLALENAGDLHGFDFHKIRAHAAELGFNIVGLSATANPKIALFIKTWKLPVFMTGSVAGGTAQVQPQSGSQSATAAQHVQPNPKATNITTSNGIIIGSRSSASPTAPAVASAVSPAENTGDEPNLHRPNDIIIENPFGIDEDDTLPEIKTVEHRMAMGPAPSTVVVTPVKHVQQPAPVHTGNETNSAAVRSAEPVRHEPAQQKVPNVQTSADATIRHIETNPEVTMIHVGNVRSGNSLYAKNKSLVVIGNVGDGAEIAADDCIYVFGSVRGRVQAGGRKNTNSIIYCSDFRPQLVSVAGIYSTIENMPENAIGRGVLVSLKNGTLEYKIQ
ncbi:MAG: hypothetical protein J6I35_07560 [Ruminobacter sp.]|uniref:septum site-determining protein MinC n=1 Tax=Ruminobacter sp. TaxID=2774296 RepID=UPI001B560939|nr:septum site-determining protein MinC [Ruminobacter sp.]MBP3749388.1 hypothetical protein [Ruminobacter sp.]